MGQGGEVAFNPISCLEEINLYRHTQNGNWDTHPQGLALEEAAEMQRLHFGPRAPAGSLSGCRIKTLSRPLSSAPYLRHSDEGEHPQPAPQNHREDE